jgi:hypothetical protein
MLHDISEGKIQLPDFQRGWVWDDDHVKSLLASVSMSYPIGTVMLLETGNADVRFRPRPVEGLDLDDSIHPERLILDGQQRLTSLYQAVRLRRAVETWDARGKRIERWYYIDMHKALSSNGDREEAIISLPKDRIIRNFRGEPIADYSTPEKEFEAGLFPLSEVFDCSRWRNGYNRFWHYDGGQIEFFDSFEQAIVEHFKQYQVPVILLRKETPKEAVCQVFEKVNTGGVSLTAFELLTATFATDDFNLREDWAKREKQLKKYQVLSTIESTSFLQVISLLATYARRCREITAGVSQEAASGVSCKRKDVLQLTLEDYEAWKEPATEGFIRAAKFLHSQKIFSARDLPYQTQVTPLAAILAWLGEQSDNVGIRTGLARWYWCGVFGELYGSSVESRFAKDLAEFVDWLNKGTEPSTIGDAHFTPNRLLTLKTRNSAAYKGLYALLLKDGGWDFLTGEAVSDQMYFDDRIDIHHIFPKDWCIKNEISARYYDSIVNKTALSAKTNRMIGGSAPSIYLARLERNAHIDSSHLDEILLSHVIEPSCLRADDFESFFEARQNSLLQRIEKAMGKSAVRGSADDSGWLDDSLDEEATYD